MRTKVCLTMKTNGFLFLAVILTLIMLIAVEAQAGPKFTWDPVPEEKVLGYTLYGQVDGIDQVLKTVPADVTAIPINELNLTPGVTYLFFVRAYNDLGESGDSNIVPYLIDKHTPPPDLISPIIIKRPSSIIITIDVE